MPRSTTLNETADLPVKLSLELKDDQFAPDKTVAAAQELAQSDKVDVLDGVVGTANVAAARSVAEQYCVPLLAGNAGGRSANQPDEFPFTAIWSLPSFIDANVWVKYLTEKFPDGVKAAVFTANTETGKDYVAALETLTEGTNIEIVSKTTIEAADAAAPASQVTTMKASGADVLLAAPVPSGQCSALVTEVANQGWKPDAFMLTSNCSTLQLIQPAGEAAEGVLCSLYLNDPSATAAADDADLQVIVDAVKKYQPGQPITGSTMAGWGEIEVLVKAMEQAQSSPLGLSRLGILYAATAHVLPVGDRATRRDLQPELPEGPRGHGVGPAQRVRRRWGSVEEGPGLRLQR